MLHAHKEIKLMRLFYILTLTLLTTHCTLLQPRLTTPQKKLPPWTTQRTQLSRLQTWQARGVMSVRHHRQTALASFTWQRQPHRYQIRIFAPLNAKTLQITGRPGRVTLWRSSKQKTIAQTPEALMAQQLGWSLPLSNLDYWARGLPVPHKPAKLQFDAHGRLKQIYQAGWQINYLSFQSPQQRQNHPPLPRKIRLRHPNLHATLVFKRWFHATRD